ncbi:hypothetical protein PR048_015721 [Dryococelus australis]|uniref:Uncharacterized protein n=1 Tax=Dryococelus australis TaxID=614101 RepID=A0ABQ9HI96_9NEOP|nr:hypothetical protein PR048_015721 [Dryococelus australis]
MQHVQNILSGKLIPVYTECQNRGGGEEAGGFLVPILTSQAPALESLLRLVSCGYKCECRHAGLACSTMCGHCRGGSCTNIKMQDFHGSDGENDPEEATL